MWAAHQPSDGQRDAEWLSAIRRHAEAAYPLECCGALLGDGSIVHAAVPLENSAVDARVAYAVSAAEYLRAEREAAAAGLAVLGFYHSHPDAPAERSARDLAEALPWFWYAIAETRQGKVTRVATFAPASEPEGAPPCQRF